MNDKREIVRLKNVYVEYDGLTVLDDVNLSIKENDFLGIIGQNGGGKTTLLKVILGLIIPTRGEVKVFDTTPFEARRLVGYVPQTVPFDREFPISVFEAVLMGRLGHVGLFKRYTDEDKKITYEALKTVNMLNFRDRPMGKLSVGQKQRVFIARALTTNPELLLLDEPTASVDIRMQAGFYELLSRLKEKMAIVLVSHDIGIVSSYVDKIACLNNRLFYHESKEITIKELEKGFHECPVETLPHGVPHRLERKDKGE